MSISDRKTQHREEVRTAILEAARDLVLKEGWQSISIRKIAEAIQYSVPVIYDHFINKEALLLEFVRQGFSLLNKDLQKAAANKDSARQKIIALAQAYWKFASDNKPYYQLMFGLGMPSCETVKKIPEINRFSQTMLQPIELYIGQFHQTENIEPMTKFKHFWSGLHGLISLNITGILEEKSKNEKTLDDFIKSFLEGIEKIP